MKLQVPFSGKSLASSQQPAASSQQPAASSQQEINTNKLLTRPVLLRGSPGFLLTIFCGCFHSYFNLPIHSYN
jgi:hypothetical protein